MFRLFGTRNKSIRQNYITWVHKAKLYNMGTCICCAIHPCSSLTVWWTHISDMQKGAKPSSLLHGLLTACVSLSIPPLSGEPLNLHGINGTSVKSEINLCSIRSLGDMVATNIQEHLYIVCQKNIKNITKFDLFDPIVTTC